MFDLTLALCFLVLLASVRAQNASKLSVSVPFSAPRGAPTLSPTLFSLSIEQDAWTDWVGTDSPNTFLVNVLDNLKERTGQPPWFRIGADSEDRTDFNPAVQFSQTVSSTPSVATPYPEAAEVVVGDGFYQTAEHLPAGTRVVWGVNLRSNNTTAAVLEASSIKKAFDSPSMKAAGVTLDSIEIGNEPDLYGNKPWNVTIFVDQWTEFATNVTLTGAIEPGPGPKFFGPSFANVVHDADSFSALGVFTHGILDSPAGALLRTFSQHHYQCGAGEVLTDIVLKNNIRGNLTQLLPDVAVVRSHGMDYVLGETNSCFGHGAVNTSNVGGIATWTLDYLLFAPQVGVSRAFFHQGVGYKYNAIQPVTLTRSTIDASPLSVPLPPHVQPAYYAALVGAEAIGLSGVTTSVELNIDDDEVSGYAFYEHGNLKRAVLISHTMFFAGSAVPRGVKHIALDTGGKPSKGKIEVKRLFIPSADATSGLLWGGQSFDGPDGKASGRMVLQQASLDSVELSDTEIVLLYF
ncbi:glycoside hydrolase family 79 protein [Mycena leptocephala]|nr:glycoside hydrolase family 79 protein [Mycena leptocephala]